MITATQQPNLPCYVGEDGRTIHRGGCGECPNLGLLDRLLIACNSNPDDSLLREAYDKITADEETKHRLVMDCMGLAKECNEWEAKFAELSEKGKP